MQEASYWQTTAEFPSLDQGRPLPTQIDIAIIGGGYTGLAAARELAMQGARVAVFETHTFGWGASSRNGGQVLTGTKLAAGALLQKYGQEVAQQLWRNSLDCIAYIEALVQEESIACEFSRCGHLELAYKPAHFQAYERDAELLSREFNHPVRLVQRQDLRAEVGSNAYYGGLIDDASAGLHPAQYAAGLMRAALQHGAQLFEHAPVSQVVPLGAGGFEVRVGEHKLRAHQVRAHQVWAREVIVATNGYTGRATPELQRKIVPIGSYIVATEPLSQDTVDQLIPRRRMIYDSKNFLYYWRLSSDNRLVFGGRASFVPETPSTIRDSAAILRKSLIEVYPQLSEAKIDYAWGGTLGFTFDLLPHAGQTPQGLHYALGCGGHGVAMLSYLGACLARRILGDTDNNPLFNLPFPSAPLHLYTGNPWFLPFVGLYYRFLDWVK